MKVCYITSYSLRNISGVTRVVTQLSKGLKKRGIDNFVISGRIHDEIEKDPDVTAVEINVSGLAHLRGAYLAIRTAFTLIKKRNNYDIIHLQTPYFQPMLSAIVGRILRKPVIATIHGKFPKSKSRIRWTLFQITLKNTIAFSDRITFVDNGARRHYGINSGEVIENGIDTHVFSPDPEIRNKIRGELNLGENDAVFLFLGRLVAHKGIFDLLDAFSVLISGEESRVKLLVIGSGDVQKVSEKIKALGLDDHVILLGKVEEVRDYFCAADIFVLYTSPLEGLPIALLEASSCELSILSTRVSGIPDVIKDGENGLLIEYGDKGGLVDKIKLLADDPVLRENLSKKARERVIEFYNVEQTVHRYVTLYENALKDYDY